MTFIFSTTCMWSEMGDVQVYEKAGGYHQVGFVSQSSEKLLLVSCNCTLKAEPPRETPKLFEKSARLELLSLMRMTARQVDGVV